MRFVHTQKSFLLALPVLCAGLAAPSLHAGIKIWDPQLPDTNWGSGANWLPGGVPGGNDDVIASVGQFVTINVNTAPVNSLALANNAALVTNGFQVLVDDGGQGVTRVQNPGSVILVGSRPIGPSLHTDILRLVDGGRVLFQGGTVRVDTRAESGGLISGHGTFDVAGSQNPKFTNDGLILAEGGLLRLRSIEGDGTFDLDGAGGGHIFVSAGAALRIDAAMAGSFGGTADVRAKGTLSFDRGWQMNAGATLDLRGGELAGQRLVNDGLVRGHGTMVNEDIFNRGTIAASGGTLVIDTARNFPDVDLGTIEAIDGDVTIIYPPSGSRFAGVVNVGPGRAFRTPEHSLILGNDAEVNLTGGAVIGDGVSQNPGTQGTLATFGDQESRIEAANLSIFSTVIALGGDLRVLGRTVVNTGAMFSGPGTLIVDEAGTLDTPLPSIFIPNRVVNEGTLKPARAARVGQLDLGAFEQTATGRLEIQIGGLEAQTFDQVNVIADADLGGTLDVSLLDDFEPKPGDSWMILTADAINGAFADVAMPDGFEIEYSSDHVVVRFAPSCDADVTGDGVVDFNDLVVLLDAWGRNEGHPADLDGDGVVGFEDLVILLTNWGPCV